MDSGSLKVRQNEDAGPRRPVDEDEDIFGGAGRDYQPELPQSANGMLAPCQLLQCQESMKVVVKYRWRGPGNSPSNLEQISSLYQNQRWWLHAMATKDVDRPPHGTWRGTKL